MNKEFSNKTNANYLKRKLKHYTFDYIIQSVSCDYTKKNKKTPYTYKIVLNNFNLGMLNIDFIHLEYVLKKEFETKSEAKIVDLEKNICKTTKCQTRFSEKFTR